MGHTAAPRQCLPCNGHSDQCDAETGTKCINCQNDTRNGDQNRCEICKPGFMGSGQAGNNCWCTCRARRAEAPSLATTRC